MSGSAAYYINESMSESSGDSLNNSNNGNNNGARTFHQMRNGIHETGRLNGIGIKGNHYQIFINSQIKRQFIMVGKMINILSN